MMVSVTFKDDTRVEITASPPDLDNGEWYAFHTDAASSPEDIPYAVRRHLWMKCMSFAKRLDESGAFATAYADDDAV